MWRGENELGCMKWRLVLGQNKGELNFWYGICYEYKKYGMNLCQEFVLTIYLEGVILKVGYLIYEYGWGCSKRLLRINIARELCIES